MKRICVISSTRADYGLLKPVISKIKDAIDLVLLLCVTGSHLSEEFGYTYKEIEKDGFTIDNKIDLELQSFDSTGISKSMSLALYRFAGVFEQMKPDMIVLLGDRYETMAIACAAAIAGIPIAHIHGGETTEGAFDEAFRHCITKMSHLHFTSTEVYRRRVIQLGEQPHNVFNVGALGVENLKQLELFSKAEVEKVIDFPINNKTILVTFHPVTLEKNTAEGQFKELLKAIDELEDVRVIFTRSNADTDGITINYMIDKYVNSHKDKSIAFFSMGHLNYLSCMKYVGAVVGNSSSGIIETPTLGVPTINIGDRQKGRLQAMSVINCSPSAGEIKKAILKGLNSNYSEVINPYEGKSPSDEIVNIIKSYLNENKINLKKKFFDIGDIDT